MSVFAYNTLWKLIKRRKNMNVMNNKGNLNTNLRSFALCEDNARNK